jgi:hypothetical protein
MPIISDHFHEVADEDATVIPSVDAVSARVLSIERTFRGPGLDYFVAALASGGGSDGADGLGWTNPLATMGEAFSRLADNDRVFFVGNIREQLLAPLGVRGVKVVGAAGGRARHDNGARWYEPADPTAATPLLTLREQGWEVHNVLFVPSADAVSCVRARRAEDATYPDSSHAILRGCRFIGDTATPVGCGVEDHGGTSHITVEDCEFSGLVDGIKNTGGAGIDYPNRWLVRRNFFEHNTNHVKLPGYLCRVVENVLDEATTIQISTLSDAGGASAGGNFVLNNVFANAVADYTVSDGYVSNTADVWRNKVTDTAADIVALPA